MPPAPSPLNLYMAFMIASIFLSSRRGGGGRCKICVPIFRSLRLAGLNPSFLNDSFQRKGTMVKFTYHWHTWSHVFQIFRLLRTGGGGSPSGTVAQKYKLQIHGVGEGGGVVVGCTGGGGSNTFFY